MTDLKHRARAACLPILLSLFVPLLTPTSSQAAVTLAPREKLITILQTNDIHGQVEPGEKQGQVVGGMAFWAGAVRALKDGIRARYGAQNSGTLVIDAGDQFQGSLLSNFNEGELVFKSMDRIGYDAVVPGNHDYDFGPIGWLEDCVRPGHFDQDPRGALKKIQKLVRFPLLAANVYLRESLVDPNGYWVNMDEELGDGQHPEDRVNWSEAVRPDFLKPYIIKEVAGVRVALIGMDNESTPSMTMAENVSDLYFRSAFHTYLDIRAELEGRADVFVLIIHSGNTEREDDASELARWMTEYSNSWRETAGAYGYSKTGISTNSRVIDAIAAGHTHWVHDDWVNGVPIVQSGWGGDRFGRIDLVWDTRYKRIVPKKTEARAGIPLFHESCGTYPAAFCASGPPPTYEGRPVVADSAIESQIARERERIRPLARRRLGHADSVLWRDRIKESPLSNHMTDLMRKFAQADLALVNTGGLRSELDAGWVTYEEFFKVLPFSNHAVLLGPMPARTLIALLERSIQTCGAYSALMQSGLRVVFERDCSRAEKGRDEYARLIRVDALDGRTIYDIAQGGIVDLKTRYSVVTFDFLATGGSGYKDFKDVPLKRDLGILREGLTEVMLASPVRLSGEVDDRWHETGRQ